MQVEPGTVPLDDISELAALTILYSDNDAYSELREQHGGETFVQWLRDAGVEERPYVTFEDFAMTNRQAAYVFILRGRRTLVNKRLSTTFPRLIPGLSPTFPRLIPYLSPIYARFIPQSRHCWSPQKYLV
jgi:hypothetical protein